ncbi:class III lanthionine synthetase LanKC [Streptomyces pactum]|uniref:Class III lanthionine synthetase LanKC n=1 Tax=Streptomyces pactum TaxID=68249 RepID=A0ABS0NHC0_9ACTN|nr:class III lanthionine synthetase LanKC [Streptomyces pactum]
MDKRYEVFCLVDRFFYETPDRLSRRVATGPAREEGSAAAEHAAGPAVSPPSAAFYETALRPVPDGWRTFLVGDWFHVNPVRPDGSPRPGRPLQGWKIHVSACLDGAEKTAARVWDYCVPREIPFKFVPTRHALHLRNSKYAGRGSSGKFATLYPADEEELHRVLRELGEILEGEPGPYILTDLRWNDGPLYVRYGGFAHRYCVDDKGSGALVPAIEDDTGRLVPDRRDPTFHVPDWVTLPAFLEPQLAARNATTVGDLPYRIDSALHFSNGGGVYRGTDTRTGEQVVLKEARPHAGLAADGADAVERLEREKAALERLAGLGVAPEVRDWFTLGDHRFLVMEYLPGNTLNSFFARRHPLLSTDPDPEALAEYTRWALDIHAAVERAVAVVHDQGMVFNDLHMFNVMVAPDEQSVKLLDFEAAADVTEGRRQAMAHPGFIAPADRSGYDVDRYALACLRLALFVPMTSVLVIDRDKAEHLAEVAAAQFPVDRSLLDEAVAVITGRAAPTGRPVTAAPRPGTPASPAPRPRPPEPHPAKRIPARWTPAPGSGRRAGGGPHGTCRWSPTTGRAAGSPWCAPSSPPPPPSGTTVSSRATSHSSPTAAASGWRTARPECCTPSTPPARAGSSRGRSGCSPAPRPRRPAHRSASTTDSPASPTYWTGSATATAPWTWSDGCWTRNGSGSAPTCTAVSPGSGWRWTTSPAPPVRRRCTTGPRRRSRYSPTASGPARGSGPVCCTAPPAPPCSSSGDTRPPATRHSSTWPPAPSAPTWTAVSPTAGAPSWSTRASGPCRTSAAAASASRWCSTATWPAGRTRSCGPPR